MVSYWFGSCRVLHWGGYCSSSYCDALRSFQCCHGEFGFVYNPIPITTRNGERQRTTTTPTTRTTTPTATPNTKKNRNKNNNSIHSIESATTTTTTTTTRAYITQLIPSKMRPQRCQSNLPLWILASYLSWILRWHPRVGCLLFPKTWPKCGIPSQVT